MGSLFVYTSLAGLISPELYSYVKSLEAGLLCLALVITTDFITGIFCASLFKSQKTKNGGLESNTCMKGLARKSVILLVVLLGAAFDFVFGMRCFCNSLIIGFILSELLSVVENCGIMGIPLPKTLTNMIEKLRKEVKEESEDENAA